MTTSVVFGAGGFIGWHLSKRLKDLGRKKVIGADLKEPEFGPSVSHEFLIGDLREKTFMKKVLSDAVDSSHADIEIFQLAADMGGAGYIFTGEHDSDIMFNSASINLNLLESVQGLVSEGKVAKGSISIFYSSSACIYPEYAQTNSTSVDLPETAAYPAEPDSEYGWEKLFSERLFAAFQRNYGITTKIARYHNIYGPMGTWDGGKEKAPAAICRKIAALPNDGGEISVWGDGLQSRSFLFIEDCIDATLALMKSNFEGPVNIGSEEMVTINELVEMVSRISKKAVFPKHDLTRPTGVRGRNSNNDLIRERLSWNPKFSLEEGLELTYSWIHSQLSKPSELDR